MCSSSTTTAKSNPVAIKYSLPIPTTTLFPLNILWLLWIHHCQIYGTIIYENRLRSIQTRAYSMASVSFLRCRSCWHLLMFWQSLLLLGITKTRSIIEKLQRSSLDHLIVEVLHRTANSIANTYVCSFDHNGRFRGSRSAAATKFHYNAEHFKEFKLLVSRNI